MQLHLCLLSGFDSHSWKMQVKCVQKKYFTYLIDKIVSFKINFSKTLVIQFYFFIIIFIFITSIFQPCIPSGRFSKWAFCFSIIKMCKFGISMVNIKQIVWEPMKHHLCHMSKVAIHFHNIKKMFIYSTLLMFN